MSTEDLPSPISLDELNTCVKVLSKFNSKTTYSLLDSNDFDHLRPLVHDLFHIEKRRKRKRLQEERAVIKQIDRTSKDSCLLRAGRAQKLQQLQIQHILVPDGTVETHNSSSDIPHRLLRPISCYICKLNYRTLHFFYDRLCPACAKLNFEKRLQTTDLSNCVALVTGGRVKIGFRIVLKLLRARCFVIATSRFPMDFLTRLTEEGDFEQWKERIHVYGVDFRYSQLVEQFTQMIIEKYDRLDFLINNACQTIQRPKEYYRHLIAKERLTNYSILPNDMQQILDGNLQFYKELFPLSQQYLSSSASSQSNEICPQTSSSILFDVNNQPIDFRSTNSWTSRLADLSTNEINEVLTINTLAPFILNSKLKVLMADKHPTPESKKFIINVSAMEGSFSRPNKTDRHPHTNAAKAALNMITRTSASDYKKSNIYMVSVDTGQFKLLDAWFLETTLDDLLGWINDENPLERAFRSLTKQDFQTPLDEDDAAARVLDPIIDTYRQIAEGKTDISIPYGCFLKDYQQCDW